MEFFEKTISQLVENQFPSFYEEEGPIFIDFVKKYYEWMESSNNTIYHSRRLMEYGDIDSTIDDFILYFKSKYLNAFQFDTATNTEQLVKHSLDVYRSKGTERGLDVFFKTVFGKPAKVYFPGEDMFRSSNGEWFLPRYLEVSFEDNLKDFINTQIEGINSGATAFVEKYIRKKINGRYIEVFYISDIVGSFETGERIKAAVTGVLGPVVTGSMNNLDVIDGGVDFSVGDIIDLVSDHTGAQGKARVSNTTSASGRVTFELVDGGWGYTNTSQIIISNNIVRSDYTVVGSNNYANSLYNQFETLIQPLANVSFYDLSGDMLANGDFVYRYEPTTNTYIGQGRVLSVTNTSSTNGTALVSITDGYMDIHESFTFEDGNNFVTEQSQSWLTSENITISDQFLYHDEANDSVDFSFSAEDGNNIIIDYSALYKLYTTTTESGIEVAFEDDGLLLMEEDSSSSRISVYTDVSAYANVMVTSSNVMLYITNGAVQFSNGEVVYQSNGGTDTANGYVRSISYTGSNAVINITNSYGTWDGGDVVLYSKNTASEGTVNRVVVDVAVYDVHNTFVSTNNNVLYGLSSNTFATASLVEGGNGASFTLNDTFLYTENTEINSDIIANYVDVYLSQDDFGFDGSTNTDLDTVISDAFNYDTYTYGTIKSIVSSGVGLNYSYVPYVLVYEPNMVELNKQDFVVNVSNLVGTFITGEVVTQGGYNKGIVKSNSNSTVLFLKRITTDDTFDELYDIVTEDSNNIMTEDSSYELSSDEIDTLNGLTSGATCVVSSYYYDSSSPIAGLNAVVTPSVATGAGQISEMEIVDSGFGFYNNEIVTFTSNTSEGSARVNLNNYGKSQGFYRKNDSELSANKYIQDSSYYQEFSYEIQTAITLDKYKDMLKNILHIAGTKFFSKFLLETVSYNEITADPTTVVTANNG